MKMVLIDDEFSTLDLLEKIIDWKALGVEIVGKAQDGNTALEIIDEKKPDIIIVDIKMPYMDGLELISLLRKKKLKVKIIILSAYGEFEYAQKALSEGVSGYLLKPVDEQKLEVQVKKLIQEIEEENVLKQYMENRKPGQENAEPASIPENGEVENRLVLKVKEYVRTHYNRDISLEEICDVVSMSKNYFCNFFKKETGENIWDYLTRVRIQKAKELLDKTNLKNYEISFKVGYENPSYFSKIFKEYTGVTPYEYRMKRVPRGGMKNI